MPDGLYSRERRQRERAENIYFLTRTLPGIAAVIVALWFFVWRFVGLPG